MLLDTQHKPFRTAVWFLLIIYLLMLTKMVIFKRSPADIKDHFLHGYRWQKEKIPHANFTPFATIKLYWNSHLRATYKISNLLGNLIGFVPLGILLPLLFTRLRDAWKIMLCSFALSLAFETFQLISRLGSFDVDDLILNTLGGIIGYFLFWLLTKLTLMK